MNALKLTPGSETQKRLINWVIRKRVQGGMHIPRSSIYKACDDADPIDIDREISDLLRQEVIYQTIDGCLSDRPYEPTEVTTKPQPPKPEKGNSKPNTLTLTVSPGLIHDLRSYAKQQGTSIEMEASFLLAEVVRLYKASKVINV